MLELLRRSLGPGPAGVRTAAFFRWKHLANPFGRSPIHVAVGEGGIVAVRAFLRWRFAAGTRRVRALRPVDTATAPQARGRGVFTRLTTHALAAESGEFDLVFNTPNDVSLGGYLKLGWSLVGRVPIRVRPTRPIRFVRSRPWQRDDETSFAVAPAVVRAERAADVVAQIPRHLIVSAPGDDVRLRTDRTSAYLEWRYADAPLGYHAVVDRTGATVVFRVRPRGRSLEATVAEVFVEPGDVGATRRLLRAVEDASSADHLSLAPAAGSTLQRAIARTSVRAPGGITLVARPADATAAPVDPLALSSWALELGDLEVF